MDWSAIGILLAGQILGYLIGAIPFGYLIYKAKTGRDVRLEGSGNIGATNVGRLLGLPFFILVFLLDFLKGALPVLGALWLRGEWPAVGTEYLPVAVGFAAILGHVFPIYLGMKGGKGVATAIGVLICLVPWPTVAGLVAWVVTLLLGRMISLASIVFALTFAAVHLIMTPTPFDREKIVLTVVVIALAVLVIVRHRSNIARILTGTEPKIGRGRAE